MSHWVLPPQRGTLKVWKPFGYPVIIVLPTDMLILLSSFVILCPPPWIWVPGMNVRSISISLGGDRQGALALVLIPFKRLLFCSQFKFVKSKSSGFFSIVMEPKQLLLRFTFTLARSKALVNALLLFDWFNLANADLLKRVCGFCILLKQISSLLFCKKNRIYLETLTKDTEQFSTLY